MVGECLGELKFPPSESDDEGDGAEGGRRDGGGDAGGGTGLGLGLGTGRETGLGEVTAGGDEIDDSLAAADCLGGNCIWAANLKRREEKEGFSQISSDYTIHNTRIKFSQIEIEGCVKQRGYLGRGSERGTSFNRSRGLLGSVGKMFSGLSSNKGVPGLELSPDSFPLRTVTSLL